MVPHVEIAFVKHWEGYSAIPYRDHGGWSWGYGFWSVHRPSGDMTRSKAGHILERKLQAINHTIAEAAGRPLNRLQIAALADFAYNVGLNAALHSTLFRYVRAGRMAAADRQFGRWVYCGRHVLPGLVKRRAAEAKLFAGG